MSDGNLVTYSWISDNAPRVKKHAKLANFGSRGTMWKQPRPQGFLSLTDRG